MQRHPGRPRLATVLFTDIVDSTSVAAEMGDRRWRELLGRHHQIVRRELKRFQGKENDTAGDSFFATFDRPNEAIRCAVAATEAVRELGVEIRAAVTFGEVENLEGKAGGMVVNTCARVMSVAGPGEVLVPASVPELIPGAGIAFSEHGIHQLKGLGGDHRLFRVMSVDGHEVAAPLEPPEAAERRREIFPTGGRRGRLVAAVAGLFVVALLGTWLLLSGGPEEKRSEGATSLRDSVVRVDAATGRVLERVSLGGHGTLTISRAFVDHPMAVGEGGVWVLRPPLLLHIDPRHAEVRPDEILVGFGFSTTVVTGFDAVWALKDGTVFKVNPATDEEAIFAELERLGGKFALAVGRFLWIGVSDGRVVRIDPASGKRTQVDTSWSIDGIAATRDGVWLVDTLAGVVVRLDPATLGPVGAPLPIEGSLDQIVGDGSYAWVLDRQLGAVTQIDVGSNTITGSQRVGESPTGMAVGFDAVWVGDRNGSIYRVDASTLTVSEIAVGAEILAVGLDESTESIWAYVGELTEEPASG